MPEPTPRTRVLKAVAAASIACLVSVGVSGCSKSASPSAPPTTAPSVQSAPLVVRLSTITGTLRPTSRAALRADVGRVIDGWWQSAYLTVGTKDPFSRSFTAGAAKLAKRDADLLSNAGMSGITAVAAKRREADLDILAVRGAAKGITAVLHLTYDTTGDRTQRCAVGGTVSLTPSGSGWRIFGYDVTHTCHPRKAGS